MENSKFDGKNLEKLSDEELKEVTGGGDPFAEALKDMRKLECEGITKKDVCESLSYCFWKRFTVVHTAVAHDSAKCEYRG